MENVRQNEYVPFVIGHNTVNDIAGVGFRPAIYSDTYLDNAEH